MRASRLLVLVLQLIFVGTSLAGTSPAAADPGLARFHAQRLTWSACDGIDNARIQCAIVRVPLDYRHPSHRSIGIGISRLPASDPAARRGVLLTTGGGPGGPGVPLPGQLAGVLDPAVTASYDLIGFDIRFLERSTPVGCGQSKEEPGGYWVRSAAVADSSASAASAAEARAYARECAAHSGWALPFANTANAARDMDIIRSALGERKISYFGGSYAGLLGTYYAALFPRRVDRFALDSPDHGDDVWRPFELARTPDFEHGLQVFAEYVAANNATFGLGATPEAVKAKITELYLSVGPEIGTLALLAVFVETLFPLVATDLAAIAAGLPAPIPLPVTPVTSPGAVGVPADNHTAVNTMYRCGDAPWPRNLETYRQDVATYGALYPTYGPATANVNPCAFWPSHVDNRVDLDSGGAPPMLFTGATRDVAVPLRFTIAAKAHFPGSRLVTVDAQYHAPFPYFGNACLNGAVTAFLVSGTLADRAC